jgi:photosystem II stability/assembly factor-like uncharacterized protein
MTRSGLILLVIACLGCESAHGPLPSQGEWTLVQGTQSSYFHGLHFADEMNGWAVGDSGRILNTKDGGDSWISQQSGTTVTLKCVQFVNPAKGWIGAGNNSIGHSTNGGVSWSWQHPAGEPRRMFMGVSFVSENTGWIVDNFGGIIHTEDGGSTWTPQTSGTTWAITSVQFLDASEGWATATNRVVLHTTDGGNHWEVQTLDGLDYGRGVVVVYQDIFFVNRSRGWIATVSGVSDTDYHPTPVLSTFDAGKTWDVRITPEEDMISAITFANDNVGWGASGEGILYTEDGGDSWTFQLPQPSSLFVDICSASSTRCWALTFEGRIYRYGP